MQQVKCGPTLRWGCELRRQMCVSSSGLEWLASVYDWLNSCNDKADFPASRCMPSRCMPRRAYVVPVAAGDQHSCCRSLLMTRACWHAIASTDQQLGDPHAQSKPTVSRRQLATTDNYHSLHAGSRRTGCPPATTACHHRPA